MLEQSRNGRSSEWLKLRFEHNSTILIGLLLLVVAESMHVPDDVFVILFSNILAKRMSLCLLVQVAINWCSNVAQCNLYRYIEFPFCAPWARGRWGRQLSSCHSVRHADTREPRSKGRSRKRRRREGLGTARTVSNAKSARYINPLKVTLGMMGTGIIRSVA